MVGLAGMTTAGGSAAQGITGITRPSTVWGHCLVLELYWESSVALAAAGLALSNGAWSLAFEQQQTGGTPDFDFLRLVSVYSGEGSTFNITWNATLGSVWRVAILRAYADVSTQTIFRVSADSPSAKQAGAASDATAIAPGLTTSADFALLDFGCANLDAATLSAYTAPLVEQVEFNELSFAFGTQDVAGASGNKQATLSVASWWAAGLIGYRGRQNVISEGTPTWDYPRPPLRDA